MKKKLLTMTICFFLVITIITVLFHMKWYNISEDARSREQIVALNEIEQLTKEVISTQNQEAYNKLEASVQALQKEMISISNDSQLKDAERVLWSMYVICILFILCVLGYLYYVILRPFDKLKDFTEELAKGNFDAKLKVERKNFFGAFTWAFDHMRREITKARDCEQEAIDNNKTVIATLSHDIKTPIASIRAYAEALDASLDTDYERRRRYATVIMTKCDEVTKLTNDLFLHSLADMDRIKIEKAPVRIEEVLPRMIEGIAGDNQEIAIRGEVQKAVLLLDIKRFEQVMENLINNSLKYAGNKIDISTTILQNDYIIVIRDYGTGIADEDMPFVFEKFYRGKNVLNRQGSGLGLYIVKYICEKMNGTIELHNTKDGLEARISIPLYQK